MKYNYRNLLTVKSIVTLLLTVVFAILCVLCVVKGYEMPQYFVTVYSVIVSFYFGTQFQKSIPKDSPGENLET